MRILGGMAAFGVGLMIASVAMAADPPDLVGTWKATGESHGAVHLGDGNDHHPEYDEPTFGSLEHAWTIVIDEQKGRAFHGVARSPQGGEEEIVGVVRFNGKQLVIAGSVAGVFGEIFDDKIEFCFQDHDDGRASVACFVAAKE